MCYGEGVRDERRDGLREIAAEQPDHVYEKQDGHCLYVHSTDKGFEPGCIIGVFLLRNGVTAEELTTEQVGVLSTGPKTLNGKSATELPYWADDNTTRLALDVQCEQDRGSTWGSAVVGELKHRGLPGLPVAA